MRYRLRRRQPETELNITPFLNLMVVLVPFLLITAAFSHFSILDLYLPAARPNQQDNPKELHLEVVIRPQALELGDRNGGLIQRLAKGPEGYDLKGLNDLLTQLKARYPDKRDITLLSEADTRYEVLVQVMDAVRVADVYEAGGVTQVELFPEISLGDAPGGKSAGAEGRR